MGEGSWLETEENWLEASIFYCPCCGVSLFRMIHSPMCDDHRLYCNRCPHAVEISFYDPVYERAVEGLTEESTWVQAMARVEPLLKSCSCGGRFGSTELRHCYMCGSLVLDAFGKDLDPYTGSEDKDREPTPDEQAMYDQFAAEFIRLEDIWM